MCSSGVTLDWMLHLAVVASAMSMLFWLKWLNTMTSDREVLGSNPTSGFVIVLKPPTVTFGAQCPRNRPRNTKLEYVIVYENSSDNFDIGLRRIKVKVTVGIHKCSPFTTIQTVRSYISTLV